MTNLRSGINKFKVNLFKIFPLVMDNKWPPQDDRPLPNAHAGALDDNKVVFDFTVVGETAQRIDRFDGPVCFGRTVVLIDDAIFSLVASTDSVDLFVDLDPMVVAFLTTSGNGVRNPGWMPSTDTGDFPETSVRFPGQFFGAPS